MGSSPSVSPATFQEEMDYQKKQGAAATGGNYGIDPSKDDWYGAAVQGEVRRRRKLLDKGLMGGQPVDAAPDLADAILRDVQTGKLRRARGGSTASALGTYSPGTLLGGAQ